MSSCTQTFNDNILWVGDADSRTDQSRDSIWLNRFVAAGTGGTGGTGEFYLLSYE